MYVVEKMFGFVSSATLFELSTKQKLALLYLKDADFAAVLAKADALRAAYDVTVLPQAKKLGKQFGTLEAAGYNAVAFADNDDIKVLGQKAE